MIDLIIKLIISHLIGDYVLQIDFIAKTKGDNFYHLLVHCILYCVPFYLFFGADWRLLVILISHIIIDILKARYKKINYITDQILHYFMMIIYCINVSFSDYKWIIFIVLISSLFLYIYFHGDDEDKLRQQLR